MHPSATATILHIDADAFFASVEQAIDPKLKGKPVVTGGDRGIVIALSYEAKAKGVRRGMMMHQARQVCPELITKHGDFETYGLFSRRMFEIMRRVTPQVEEASIDEAYADVSGLRRLHRCSYAEMAFRIKEDIQKELDLTVSVGVSFTKTLAKLASRFKKPNGFYCVGGRELRNFTQQNPIGHVCGIGPNSQALLNKHGIKTVFDFVEQPCAFAKNLLGKLGAELWQELTGTRLYEVSAEPKSTYQSISKFKTFTPPSENRERLFAELLLNMERAFAKMRRFDLATKRLAIVLKKQTFRSSATEIKFSRPVTSTLEFSNVAREQFDQLYEPRTPYRATGVFLCDLTGAKPQQLNFFEDPVHIEKIQTLSAFVDEINERYGSYTLSTAQSLLARPANLNTTHSDSDDESFSFDLPELKNVRV